MRRLKYFPKKDWSEKLNAVPISCIDIAVFLSNIFASSITYESIHSPAVRPLTILTIEERCFDDTRKFLA